MAWKAWSSAVRRRYLEGSVAATLILAGPGAVAADFTYEPPAQYDTQRFPIPTLLGELPRHMVRIRGSIEVEDVKRLKAFLESLPIHSPFYDADGNQIEDDRFLSREAENYQTPITLSLDSKGVSFEAAIQIGRLLRERRDIATLVERDAVCLSACAVIFMFGQEDWGIQGHAFQRYLESGGVIGFHRPTVAVSLRPSGSAMRASPEALAAYIAQEFSNAYDAASQQIQEMLEIHPEAWNMELIVSMLTATGRDGAEPFVYLDTVDDAIRWGVDVLNLIDPPRRTREDQRRRAYWLCANETAQYFRNHYGYHVTYGEDDFRLSADELELWTRLDDDEVRQSIIWEEDKVGSGEFVDRTIVETAYQFVVTLERAMSFYVGCGVEFLPISDEFSVSSFTDGTGAVVPETATVFRLNSNTPISDLLKARLYSFNPRMPLALLAATTSEDATSGPAPQSAPLAPVRP